jgi:hypothetical protein
MSRRPCTAASRSWLILLAAVGTVLLAACAGPGLPASPQDPEAQLKGRARDYWESRKRGDLVAQYGFQPPVYREQVTLTAFIRGKGATQILSYDLKEVSVTGDVGLVKLRVTYKATHPLLAERPPGEKGLDQAWVRLDGEWYLKGR